MRVLHVYRTYFPETQGGLEEVIRQIARNTSSRGADVRVFSLSRRAEPRMVAVDGIEVYRIRQSFELASCGMAFRGLRSFRSLCEWADVVHYHFPWPFGDWLHLTNGVPRPAIVTYHSDIIRQQFLRRLYEPLMHRFLDRVDAIACTSPNYLATSPVLSRYSRIVEVIPIGLTEASYPTPDDGLLTEVEKQHGRDFFLFVGVLRYYKGLHILLEAMKGAPFRVIIVGSGPTEAELRSQARRLRLDNVEFTGYLDDLRKMALFRLARGVVFPSYLRSEAFGVTLLEGAMNAKPLVSTEVGSGTSHVNVDGQTGIIVPPGSSMALRRALDQLWYRPEMAKLMGQRARERYEKLFTGELMGLRYMELYQRVMDDATTSRPGRMRQTAD